jgi:PAS domain S-box-containing protein
MLDPFQAGRLKDSAGPGGPPRAPLAGRGAGESLDRLARLAARGLHAPLSLVTLLGDGRPRVAGCAGLPDPWAATGESPLFGPLCRRVIEAAAPLLVDDLGRDPSVAPPPLGLAAYLGVPLLEPTGVVVGVLCAADRRPRPWSRDEVETLQELAAAVEADLALRADARDAEPISRELEETVERFRLVMRATNDTIWEWNLETGEGTWNEGIHKMFGYPAPQAAPTHRWWAERIHPDDRERIISGTRRAIEGNASVWSDEYRFRHASGAYLTVLDRAYIARDGSGRAQRIVGSMIDITEKSRVQQEREQLLARESAARGEAEAANRAKGDFLAVMSHELRTPLTAIMGFTDLLLEGIPVPVPPQARAQVERIDYAAQHLLQLIEQVLQFARVEAAKEVLDLREVDLREVARAAAALIEPLARRRDLAFEVRIPDAPLVALTEDGKARQIVLNLLSNAVKFTAEGGVRLLLEQDGAWAVIRILDTGVGIAPEHLERVWEPFWQAQQGNTRQVGGTGLGLSVCRELSRLLGGELRVASEVGAGSEFSLRLPCLRP